MPWSRRGVWLVAGVAGLAAAPLLVVAAIMLRRERPDNPFVWVLVGLALLTAGLNVVGGVAMLVQSRRPAETSGPSTGDTRP